jgi:hypothetical protein
MDEQITPLEEVVKNSSKKTVLVDTAGNITYSLITGTLLDLSAGLDFYGIITSRATGTAINSVTGGAYGWWREQAYRITNTNNANGKIRKTIVDLLAFNTFQVPVYATSVAIGSLVSEGKVDWEKVKDGTAYLVTISPFIAPTMGWYMDWFRKLFGVKSAAETAYKK